jgi:hypothetical protein
MYGEWIRINVKICFIFYFFLCTHFLSACPYEMLMIAYESNFLGQGQGAENIRSLNIGFELHICSSLIKLQSIKA